MTDDFTLTPPEPSKFTACKQLIEACYQQRGWLLRWGGMECNQLSRLLKEMPQLTPEIFRRALFNIAESGDIPKGQRPGQWLPKLEAYIVEAHNTFGRHPSDTAWDLSARERAQRLQSPSRWRAN